MTSDEIKDNVTMRQVLSRYGLKPNRSGMICCPFHNEKTPSMKIYEKDYHCFGCGEHGDIFTFVQNYEGVDFKTAFQILGGSYGVMKFSQKRAQYESRIRQKQREKEQARKLDERKKCGDALADLREKFRNAEPFSDEWCSYQKELEKAELRYEQVVMGGGEE